ncbi:Golgi apparatus membrane protein tvp38 [Penicillium diatomitis]|uniref:Golgi apparatus membrane protein TVP38 n=1 Tax=Penicillium diatomitis TaxID=2819901 RepID=A0A9W9X2S2_9EURO|nr:Golgi apparatus membrane protein tvp38 [Penicillium diatomitis]KAJ5482808.1 Golgi apparatus membrane protein tvp38 [Penicillium diatomitis]
MPADYESTARALSLTDSPPEPLMDSHDEEEDEQPIWSRSGRRDSSARWSGEPALGFRDRMMERGKMLWRLATERYNELTLLQKIGLYVASFAALALGVGIMLLTGKLFIWLGPVAEQWQNSWLVAFVIWIGIFFISFPPLVGWSTLGTVAGFIYGWWKGWLIYSTATVVGSTASFYVSRTVLSKFVNRMMERDKRFAALALTLKYDGLKLLCMIRLCPLPYSFCNGAVSTLPTVQPLMYGLATAIISPKLLVPAFIGSRLRLLSEKSEQMSAGSKAINIISIIVTICIGVFTGYYIYNRTLARAKELEAQEREEIRQSLQADHAAHRPHRRFSDDDDVNSAAKILAEDEEARIGLHDSLDDNVDLHLDDDSDNKPSGSRSQKQGRRSYHDNFTDNDSDDYSDEGHEAYGLHSHVPS